VIVRSKFSSIFRFKWPSLQLLNVAQFSSMKESDDNVESVTESCSNDNSLTSDDKPVASSPELPPSSQAKSGLEKAIQMFERVDMSMKENVPSSKTDDDKPVSFATMLRRSKLIGIGKPEGRVVVGTIIETMNDDLYIDFGGKFHCVCKAPRTNAE